MSEIIRTALLLFYSATGGRPMRLVDPCRFVDVVSGKSVGLYEDHFGRRWLADSGPWSLFRVARERQP